MAHANPTNSLHRFLLEAYKLCGAHLCVYDTSFFLHQLPKLALPHRLRIHSSPYCWCVKSSPELTARCIETENWRTQEAGRRGEPFLHTCYAGVTDLIVPLFSDGRQIGALFFGQTLAGTEAELEKSIDELVSSFNLPPDRLRAAAEKMPRVSGARLKASSAVVTLLKDYLEQAYEVAELRREKTALMGGDEALDEARTKINVGEIPTFLIEQLQLKIMQLNAPQVKKALATLKRNYWTNPSHREVARLCAMSESQFSREFRRLTGMTYRHCLLATRLEAAFYLIKKHLLTIEEASAAVGYENSASMQRAFKKFTGLSPRQYIRSYPRAFRLERFDEAPPRKRG
jgi:AraC-like DNA-binding protein/ligand-binding sensor protein